MTIQRFAGSILLHVIKRLAPGYVGTAEDSDALVAGMNEAIREMALEMGLAA